MERLDRFLIASALRACGGNRSDAAQLLGMPRQTLSFKGGLLLDDGLPELAKLFDELWRFGKQCELEAMEAELQQRKTDTLLG